MSKKLLLRCEFCGRRFRPAPYNAHHQICCGDAECVRERNRRRKREWNATKRATDEKFRQRENKRCAEANRRRRQKMPQEPKTQLAALLNERMIGDIILGMVAHFTDASHPDHVEAAVKSYAARGRRLAETPAGGRVARA